jgi:hypothetical protein
MIANGYKLVYGHKPGKYHIVANGNMAGKGRVVRKNTIVPYKAIMRYVAVGHDEAVLPDYGLHPVESPFINGGTFPDGGIIANMNRCFFSSVFQVLWRGRNYSSGKDIAILANSRSLHNGYIRPDPGSVSYGYVIVYGGKGFNHYILCNLGSGVNIRQGLVHSISF